MSTDIGSLAIIQWMSNNLTQIIISVVVLALYLLVDRFGTPKIEQGAEEGRFKVGAETKAVRIARLLTGFISLLVLALVWGIDFQSVFIFASTTITLLGVALVASWSLLSNITAHFILLLNSSFKRGAFVRIFDADNYVEGYLSEMDLFNTKIITDKREIIVYPNNLLLTRPVLINPRDRLNGVGKLPPHNDADKKQAAGD